jgi:hypothetical protein
VTRPPAPGIVRAYSDITLRRTLAVHRKFRTFTGAIGRASTALSRLFRIAEMGFSPRAKQLQLASRASLTRQMWRPEGTMSTTAHRLSPEAKQHDASQSPQSLIYSPKTSLSLRGLPPHRSLLGVPSPEAPVARKQYTHKQPRSSNSTADRPKDGSPQMPSQTNTISAWPRVVPETVSHALSAQLLDFIQRSGEAQSQPQHIPPTIRRRAAAVAPVAYRHSGSEPLGGVFQHDIISIGEMLTESPSGTPLTLRSHPVASAPAGSQETNDRGRHSGRGSLYLEGSVLGRWLTQRLNQEIVRPRDGIMAVDPRVTPSWGGPSLPT